MNNLQYIAVEKEGSSQFVHSDSYLTESLEQFSESLGPQSDSPVSHSGTEGQYSYYSDIPSSDSKVTSTGKKKSLREDEAEDSYSSFKTASSSFLSSDDTSLSSVSPSATSYSWRKSPVEMEQERKYFVQEKIKHLQKTSKSFLQTAERAQETRHENVLRYYDEDFVGEFCQKKMRQLHGRRQSSSEKRGDRRKIGHEFEISTGVIDKLKIENLILKMRQVNRSAEESMTPCSSCSKIQETTREKDFVKNIKRRVENKLVEQRYQDHLLKMNTVTQVGNLAQKLPRHGETGTEVWRKLMDRGVT